MLDDVEQNYFGQNIKGMDDTWKIMPLLYDAARAKADIANSIVYDLLNELKELRVLVIKVVAAI